MTDALTFVCSVSCRHSMGVKFQIFQVWCNNIKSELFLPGDLFHFQSLLWLTWLSVLLNVWTWCCETEKCSQKTAEHFCLWFDNPPATEHEVRIHSGIMPASTFVKDSKVLSNHSDAWVSERGQHGIKRWSLVDWPRKKDPCTYFDKQNMSIIVPCFCFSASLQEQRGKELQLLQHRFFFEDSRANKSSGLWQTALHRILFLFFISSTWQVSHGTFFFFLSRFLLQDYISFLSNYFFSTSYNERLWCHGCRDSRKCALQNIPSHASDMHISLHVTIATF